MRALAMVALAAVALVLTMAGSGVAAVGDTTRVSVDSSGNQANSQSYYEEAPVGNPSVSADGRYVAFYSEASNLVANDTNHGGDIFVRDRQAGTTERVNLDVSGRQAFEASNSPSISADGRYVAFSSWANLVADDTNDMWDVFVRDRQAGTTERVSVDSSGIESNSHSASPSISADGRYVAFGSLAKTLVPGDTNGREDVFVRDRQAGTTERVSVDSSGEQANFQGLRFPTGSSDPSISADGRYVAFESHAPNLVANDTNGTWDVFVRDRQAGTTERASVDSSANQANNESGTSEAHSISSDGRYVAFESHATNLVEGDANGHGDVFVRDLRDGTTELVSVGSSGDQANHNSHWPSVSSDGRYVAFSSDATNLVEGDANGYRDVFVHDRQVETTERVSVDGSGNQANGYNYQPSISADGRYVAFSSGASNLVEGDTNYTEDIFVHERGSEEECTITGTVGSDVLEGTPGDDVVCALGGDDTLRGLGGNDTLLGGDGDDTLEGGEGDDEMHGASGADTASFEHSPTAVSVSLATNSTTGEGSDTLVDMEALTGTAHNDTLRGGHGADTLKGGDGTDALFGGDGDDALKGENNSDKLDGGQGKDALDGGAGSDTASFRNSPYGVVASLVEKTAVGGEGTDALASVEKLEGSVHTDTLTGGNANNTLTGLGGNDALAGGAGDDTFYGGSGADKVHGGPGNDRAVGDSGADTLSGEDGDDSLNSKDGKEGNDSLDGGEGTNSCTTDATEKSMINCR